jgi:DNA replication and repair protein RecF
MGLQQIHIYNVRNIENQSITPSPQFNFIYGKNASGKSALIEAIFLLGRVKSFRTSSIKSVIAFDKPELIVSGQITDHQKPAPTHVGVRMDGKTIEMRHNQKVSSKRSDLAYALPIQIIHPKSFELLDGGAQIRREFLDWGVFNHEAGFLPVWKKYKKALSQRNALLKSKAISQIEVWNKELAAYGTIVHKYRSDYSVRLKPVLNATIANFLNLDNFSLNLIAGWEESLRLDECLSQDLEKDLRYGFTNSGCHRGDFQLMFGNKLAKEFVSRGQLKLLVICLKLAQVKLMLDERDYFACILIDDFAAELDKQNRAKLIKFLTELPCQIFLTATEKDDFGRLDNVGDYRMFHVEQGRINSEMVPCET